MFLTETPLYPLPPLLPLHSSAALLLCFGSGSQVSVILPQKHKKPLLVARTVFTGAHGGKCVCGPGWMCTHVAWRSLPHLCLLCPHGIQHQQLGPRHPGCSTQRGLLSCGFLCLPNWGTFAGFWFFPSLLFHNGSGLKKRLEDFQICGGCGAPIITLCTTF